MLGRAILAVVLLDVILAAPLQDGNNQYGVDVADFQEVGPVRVGVLIASSQDVQNQRSLATFIDTDEIVAQPLRQDPNVPVLSGFIAPETNRLGKREAQRTNRQAILPDEQSLDTHGVVVMSKKSLSTVPILDEQDVDPLLVRYPHDVNQYDKDIYGVQMANVQAYEGLPVGVNVPSANVDRKRAQYAFLPITDEYQLLAVDSRPLDPLLGKDYPVGIIIPENKDPFGKRVPSLSDEDKWLPLSYVQKTPKAL